MPPLRVAVVGAGAFGRNHLRVYRELATTSPDLVELAAVVDATASARDDATARYGIPAFHSVAALLASGLPLDAASVCVPTVDHGPIAEQLLQAGIDVLIEKPFAASLAEADRVLTLAAAHGRIVQIGHLERFNPAVTSVLPLLNRPMFFEAHRLSIFTPRSLDVDVVLDLMIHDLDIVLQLANSPVRELRAVGLPVLSGKVDIANVRVEFESGCIANFTASRISTEQVRKLRFFQPHQYLSLDFARQELLTINVAPSALKAAAIPLAAAEGTSTTPDALKGTGFSPSIDLAVAKAALAAEGIPIPHPSAGLSLQKFAIQKVEPLRLELESFLQSVRTRTPARVTGEQGRAALALALDINAAIASHAERLGL
jgi:predicted dehydrogenase